jgi:hypothetical protein
VSYSQQRILAVAVAIALGMLGAIAVGNAETLGLTPRILAWLAIISTGLGILQGFLPSVRGTDQKPEHIANRIMELTPAERADLIAEVEHRRILEDLEHERGPEVRMGPKPGEGV